jgi:hypothetical protein
MTKNKSLIEKVWWVIPPVFMVLVFLPVFRWIAVGRYSFSEWIGIFQYLLGSIDGRIVTIFMLGFMSIGYYLIRRKSLLLRIIVPIISAIIGFYIGFVIVFILFMY